MKNKLCNTLNIKYPIIQGAMAWTSMAPLVAAVSEAGGLGVLGSGFMPIPVIEDQIKLVRRMTDKPFAANMFLEESDHLDDVTNLFISMRIPAVYIDTLNLLDEKLATAYYKKFHEYGIKVIAKINYLEDALVAERAGADVIVAKGVDGGGHCTKVSSRVLLSEVVQHVKNAAIVASGGIALPRQAAGCTVEGADGIEMGTIFMVSEECTVHENVKNAIIQADDQSIVACGRSTGEPSWQIKNKLADRLLQIEANHPELVAAEMVRKESEGSLRIASMEGEIEEHGAVMCGPAAALIHSKNTVRQLIPAFYEEWITYLNTSK